MKRIIDESEIAVTALIVYQSKLINFFSSNTFSLTTYLQIVTTVITASHLRINLALNQAFSIALF